MNRHKIGQVFLIGAIIIAVAWQVEAVMYGRRFISTYLAPLAFIGLLVSVFLKEGQERLDHTVLGIRRHGVLLISIGAVVLLVPLLLTQGRMYGSKESNEIGAVAIVTGIALLNIHRVLSKLEGKKVEEEKNR